MEQTEQKPAKQTHTTAHVYIGKLMQKWFGGRQYGDSIEKQLSRAELPSDKEAAVNASLALLEDAARKAPGASIQTRKRWARLMEARLVSMGVVPT